MATQRVSTADQNLDMQFNALTEYGCKTIYQENISGKNTERPELKKLLESLRKGDEVVVWKLDRLGRSGGPGSLLSINKKLLHQSSGSHYHHNSYR